MPIKNLFKKHIKHKKKEVKQLRRGFDLQMIRAAAMSIGGEFRSVEVGIRQSGPLPLLVELKSNLLSPRVNLEGFQPLQSVRELIKAGLEAGVMVASDSALMGGDPSWLNLIRAHTEIPVVQRDVFIDPLQVYQGRAIGADAVLIHADILNEKDLIAVLEAAGEMGIEALLETGEVARIKNIPGDLVSAVVFDAGDQPPAELLGGADLPGLLIARTFPRSADEIRQLQDAGVQAVLLSDAFWLEPSFLEAFLEIQTWRQAL